MTPPGTLVEQPGGPGSVPRPGPFRWFRHARAFRHPAVSGTMSGGAACLAWSGCIHLDLWHLGYRAIPTVGTLFVLQAAAAIGLALLVAASRRLLPALAGAGLLLSTIGGLLWSAQWGLFGFHEHLDAPFAALSLAVETAGAVALLTAAALRHRVARATSRGRRPNALQA